MTSAPYARVFAILMAGASAGITITAGRARICAAAATPCAWLPDEKATTPPFASRGIWLILLKAPRNLNDPVRCSVSGLMNTRPPARALRSCDSSSGVSIAWPARRAAAASTAARSGSVVVVMFMFSPSGTGHTLRQGGQIAKLDFRSRRQALVRLAPAVDPDGAEAEMGSARDVPSIRADEAEARRRHAQGIDRQSIGLRMGLENADRLDRQHLVELRGEARRIDRRLQHGRRGVRQDRRLEAGAADRLQHRWRLRIGAQFPIALKQPLAQHRIADRLPLARKAERLRRHLPEVRMGAHQAAQPAVLELLAPPGRGVGVGLRPERLAPARRRAVHVEQRAVRIEDDGVDRGEAGPLHALPIAEGMQRGPAPEDSEGLSEVVEVAAVAAADADRAGARRPG